METRRDGDSPHPGTSGRSPMQRKNIFLSTIDPNAHILAARHGFGLEIAEYCTAWNLDELFPQTQAQVAEKIRQCPRRILHAPFNELFPCAIDPKAQALAAERYRQAIAVARSIGAEKVVIHGGFHPKIYYPVWYIQRSIAFWQEFLQEDPGVELVLENVLEEDPAWQAEILREVNHPNLRLCLDIGHVNAYSPVALSEWLRVWQPWLSHFHLHNNNGDMDAHAPLTEGSIPMQEFLKAAQSLCPEATFTLELMDGESSVRWLTEAFL